MKNRKSISVHLLAAVLFIALACAVPAQAGVENYSLGIGLGFVPDYEGSSDYEAVPIPYARVNWDDGKSLELQALKLKATLLRFDALTLGPLANFRPGRDDVDNERVDDLKDVDDAFELGVFAGFEIDQWNVSAEILQDVSDEHDGLLFTLGGGYRLPLDEKKTLSLGASITFADDDYMESFFEIDNADSARSGLETFDADSGLKDISFKVGFGNMLTESWRMQAIIRYSRLLGDAADSPVVDDEGSANQFLGGVVFVYTFGKGKAEPVEVEPYHF
jgi:outer membrane protein